jgi:hypothetical protein
LDYKNEDELQAAMIDALYKMGVDDIIHIPRQASPKSRSTSGLLDLHCVGLGGSFEIEVKNPNNKVTYNCLTDSQKKRIPKLRKNKVTHGVFNDFDRFMAFIKKIKGPPWVYHFDYSGIDEGCFK